jgi:hypothetical protein
MVIHAELRGIVVLANRTDTTIYISLTCKLRELLAILHEVYLVD